MKHHYNPLLPRRPQRLPPLQLTRLLETRPNETGGRRETWAVYTVEQGGADMWLGDFYLKVHAEAFIQMLYENEKR